MQYILLSILRLIARLIILRHHPYIIGVTGTVGKTTITGHIAHWLSGDLSSGSVSYSPHHYNGEYGLPLTIIGSRSPGRNPILWIFVFVKGLWRLVTPYPRYLVLEYGIDHPGEMEFLLSIAIPDIAIITPVEPNHLEQFGSLDRYRSAKLLITRGASHIIAHESLRPYIELDALYYSLGALSDIDASHVELSTEGTRAIVHYDQSDYPILLPAIGAFQIENLLPLYPIAVLLSLDPSRIAQYASHAKTEPGRSTLLAGKSDSIIIDGSYNGGYLSIRAGITSMRSFLHSHRLIFFLGDMRELGESSREIHEQLAREISDIIPHESDVSFYLVGPMMRDYVCPILGTHFDVSTSLSSRDLGSQIATTITAGDMRDTIIYAKGSQNTIFIEEGIKCLLADARDISRLPRQSDHWMDRKEEFFRQLST